MEPALKPCPYCGQQPVVSENPWGSRDVECDNGSCQVTTHVGTFEGDPFAAWNTRPGEEKAAEDERARIALLVSDMEKDAALVAAGWVSGLTMTQEEARAAQKAFIKVWEMLTGKKARPIVRP
jgi:hypothetical protein